MKHIVFVTISMRGGGTERVISVLADHYLKMGHKITILMIAENIIEYELDERIEVIPIAETTGGSLTGRMKRIAALRSYFKNHKECKIYAMGTVTAIFTMISLIGLNRFVVVSERNDPNRLNLRPITKTMKFIRNFLYGMSDAIALQTEDSRACFPDRLQKKIVVIPNPLQENLPQPNTSLNRDKTVMTALRLVKEKNLPLLIDAFIEFRKQYPEYHLNIFGQGPIAEELQSYIEQRGEAEHITMKGFSGQIYEEMLHAGIFVSPSNSEGISNSLLEALSSGIPTIATDCPIGGSKMCIQSGTNGILIKVGDRDMLEDALCRIAGDREFAQKISLEAVKVRESFSIERMGQLWLDLMGE